MFEKSLTVLRFIRWQRVLFPLKSFEGVHCNQYAVIKQAASPLNVHGFRFCFRKVYFRNCEVIMTSGK